MRIRCGFFRNIGAEPLLEKLELSALASKQSTIRVADSALKRIREDVNSLQIDAVKLENSLKMLGAVGKTMPTARYSVRVHGIRTGVSNIVKRLETISREVSVCIDNKEGSYSSSDLETLVRDRSELESISVRINLLQQNSKRL